MAVFLTQRRRIVCKRGLKALWQNGAELSTIA